MVRGLPQMRRAVFACSEPAPEKNNLIFVQIMSNLFPACFQDVKVLPYV